jgi:hypothetical protein
LYIYSPRDSAGEPRAALVLCRSRFSVGKTLRPATNGSSQAAAFYQQLRG